MVVKKYSTRRLYDTEQSRYVKLVDLAEAVRQGRELKVVDAESGEDLTQGVLLQLLLEREGIKELPSPVLERLLRLDERALREFFATWVGTALHSYLEQRAPAPAPVADAPAPEPERASDLSPDEWEKEDAAGVGSRVRPRADASTDDQVEALRREVEELKDLIRGVARSDSA
ncbi:MAG: polyhydroxyalkanoate synthesis regulator DNA-binding domain-containing protein [Deltaproteobacteria bacterium]|nr:polyhydroxyalkanoate synthesis regulator DNA-binding domain-containing protein [Deltaproteobacteria bacterium]